MNNEVRPIPGTMAGSSGPQTAVRVSATVAALCGVSWQNTICIASILPVVLEASASLTKKAIAISATDELASYEVDETDG
jgi:hypothetical protein